MFVNLGNIIAGAAQGFLTTGNPIGAGVGAIAGAFGGSSTSNVLSGAGNSALQSAQDAYLAKTENLQIQNLAFQFAEQQQASRFDNVTSEKAEIMRETNELRNVAMEQKKADDAITKEFIKSIA